MFNCLSEYVSVSFFKLLASVFALFLKYSDDRLKRCMEDVVKFTVLGKPLASIVVH